MCFRRTIEPTGGTEGPESRTAPTNLADSLPYRWSLFRHSLGDDAELGPLEPWQAVEFACHVDRVRGSIADWIPFAQWVVDQTSARTYLQDYADRQAADTGRLFGIYVAGTLRGGIIVKVFDTTRGVCELGVWLDPAVRGRGLVTRAARVLIDWALRARAMTRVEWRCDPRNESSIAAARRLGFVHEGTHRKAWYHDGEHRDVQVWAIVT